MATNSWIRSNFQMDGLYSVAMTVASGLASGKLMPKYPWNDNKQ